MIINSESKFYIPYELWKIQNSFNMAYKTWKMDLVMRDWWS